MEFLLSTPAQLLAVEEHSLNICEQLLLCDSFWKILCSRVHSIERHSLPSIGRPILKLLTDDADFLQSLQWGIHQVALKSRLAFDYPSCREFLHDGLLEHE